MNIIIAESVSKKQQNPALLLIYSILCFYCLGAVMMINFCDYPSFDRIHENVTQVFGVFSRKVVVIYYVPTVLLFFCTASLWFYTPKTIPKWMFWASFLFSFSAVIIILFVLIPAQPYLLSKGFNGIVKNRLTHLSLYFQVIPAWLQAFLAFFILNAYFKNVNPFNRILFIGVFALVFYLVGADNVEKFINYSIWTVVCPADWLSFRASVPIAQFLSIYVVPGFFPIFLLVPMFWWRPQGITKTFVLIVLLPELWACIVTGNYFVPNIQVPLGKAYSLPLIEELIKNEFPLRGTALIMLIVATVILFLRVARHSQNTVWSTVE